MIKHDLFDIDEQESNSIFLKIEKLESRQNDRDQPLFLHFCIKNLTIFEVAKIISFFILIQEFLYVSTCLFLFYLPRKHNIENIEQKVIIRIEFCWKILVLFHIISEEKYN